MPGNRAGGLKAAAKNKQLYGLNYYKQIGHLGGVKRVPKGFSSDKVGKDGMTGRERAVVVGSEGGKNRWKNK